MANVHLLLKLVSDRDQIPSKQDLEHELFHRHTDNLKAKSVKDLTRYVPFRLIRPFFRDKLKAIKNDSYQFEQRMHAHQRT